MGWRRERRRRTYSKVFCRGGRCECGGTRTSIACQSFLQGWQVRVRAPRSPVGARIALLAKAQVGGLHRRGDAPIGQSFVQRAQVWVHAPRWPVRGFCRDARRECGGTRTSESCRVTSTGRQTRVLVYVCCASRTIAADARTLVCCAGSSFSPARLCVPCACDSCRRPRVLSRPARRLHEGCFIAVVGN